MTMYREEIERYIDAHTQEMLEDIKSICAIDSQRSAYKEGMPFGEGPARALGVALEMAEKYGFFVCNYDNFAGAIDLFQDKEKQLDILAHLDVVPEGEGWTETEPFVPVIKGDKIFGRGTSDDKGPAIAALYAMRAVKELNLPVSKNVRLILGTDEETNSECIEHYYEFEKEAPMTFTPDGEYPVVNIEKGRLPGHFVGRFGREHCERDLASIHAGTKINVVPPKAKAVISGFALKDVEPVADEVTKEVGIRFEFDLANGFEITAMGENAHGSTPEHGNNALTGLLMLIDRLDFGENKKVKTIKDLYHLMPHNDFGGEGLGIAVEDEKSGALTLAFSMLSLEDHMLEGFFDARVPVSGDAKQILETCHKKFKGIGLEFTNDHMVPPHEVDENSEFVQTLLRVYSEYTGQKGECIAIGGGTYVHNIKNGVAFGAVMPGTDTRMHGADEFAVISELVVTAKIIAQCIVDLCH